VNILKAGLPLGRLADTGRRRRLLAMGAGEAVRTPAASWIGGPVLVRQRARAVAGFIMAVPIGPMLSSVVSGPAARSGI